MGWCYHEGSAIHLGDLNGDGRSDMLCHDTVTGYKWGVMTEPNAEPGANSWELDMQWCHHPGARLLVGDFDGDKRTDMLCNDRAGHLWIAYANHEGRFDERRWEAPAEFCKGHPQALQVHDFNGDERDDLFCQLGNEIWVTYADAGGVFAD